MKTATIIRAAMAIVKNHAESCGKPGILVQEDGRPVKLTYKQLYFELSKLSKGDIIAVSRCADCDCYYAAPRSKTGSCFPKDHSCGHKPGDYCSANYVPRTETRRKVDESVNKLLQKERTGNGV